MIGFVAAGPAIHDGPFSLIRCTGGAVMAKKFAELRARMSAEARARSEQTAADTLAELQLPKDQSSTRRAGFWDERVVPAGPPIFGGGLKPRLVLPGQCDGATAHGFFAGLYPLLGIPLS